MSQSTESQLHGFPLKANGTCGKSLFAKTIDGPRESSGLCFWSKEDIRVTTQYHSHVHMPLPRKISLHPQATVENAHTDNVIQLAIDFYHANRNTTTVPYSHPLSRIKKTGISIQRVTAMNKILFPRLQLAIVAGGELQPRFEAHKAEMVLTVAQEAVLEEWCLVMCSTDGDLLFG